MATYISETASVAAESVCWTGSLSWQYRRVLMAWQLLLQRKKSVFLSSTFLLRHSIFNARFPFPYSLVSNKYWSIVARCPTSPLSLVLSSPVSLFLSSLLFSSGPEPLELERSRSIESVHMWTLLLSFFRKKENIELCSIGKLMPSNDQN